MDYFRLLVFIAVSLAFSQGQRNVSVDYVNLNETFYFPKEMCNEWTMPTSFKAQKKDGVSYVVAYKEAVGNYFCDEYLINLIIMEKRLTFQISMDSSIKTPMVGDNITLSCSMSAYLSITLIKPKKFFIFYNSSVEIENFVIKDDNPNLFSPVLSTTFIATNYGETSFTCQWDFVLNLNDQFQFSFSYKTASLNITYNSRPKCRSPGEEISVFRNESFRIPVDAFPAPYKYEWSCTLGNSTWTGDEETFKLFEYGVYNCSFIAYNSINNNNYNCTWNRNVTVKPGVNVSIKPGNSVGMIVGIIFGCLFVIIIIISITTLILSKRCKKKEQNAPYENHAVISYQETIPVSYRQNEEHNYEKLRID